nr:hypothetical protein [Chrysanthemum kita-like virus]
MMYMKILSLVLSLVVMTQATSYDRNAFDNDIALAWLFEVKEFDNYKEVFKFFKEAIYNGSELIYTSSTNLYDDIRPGCVKFVEPSLFEAISCVLPPNCGEALYKVMDESVFGTKLYMCYSAPKTQAETLEVYKLRLPTLIDARTDYFEIPDFKIFTDNIPDYDSKDHNVVLTTLDRRRAAEDFRFIKLKDRFYPMPAVCNVVRPGLAPDIPLGDFELIRKGDRVCYRKPSEWFKIFCSIDFWKNKVGIHCDNAYEAAFILNLEASVAYRHRKLPILAVQRPLTMTIPLSLPYTTSPNRFMDDPECKRIERVYAGKTDSGAKFYDLCPVSVKTGLYTDDSEPSLKLVRRDGVDFSPFVPVEECVHIKVSSSNPFLNLIDHATAAFAKLFIDLVEPMIAAIFKVLSTMLLEFLIRLLSITPVAESIITYIISYYWFRDHFLTIVLTITSVPVLLSIYHIL